MIHVKASWLRPGFTLLMAGALAVSLGSCGGTVEGETASRTTPAGTQPAPATTATTSPTTTIPPIGTPFEMDELVMVDGVSSIAGTGTLKVTLGEESGWVELSIDGSVPVVDGRTCEFCMETLELGPGAVVAADLFNDHEAQGTRVDLTVGLMGPMFPDGSSLFIVAGEEGAMLEKDGAGFRLTSGTAWLVTDRSLIDPDFGASAPTSTATTSTTLPEPENLVLITANPEGAREPLKVDVLEGELRLVSGTTARAGSSFSVFEEWLELSPGLGIDVGSDGLLLFGQTYAAGTRLVVQPDGSLAVVGTDQAVGNASPPPVDTGAAAEFCAMHAEIIVAAQTRPEFTSTEARAEWYEQQAAMYEEMVLTAPIGIEDDAAIVATAMQSVTALLAEHGYDFMNLLDDPEASAAFEAIADESGQAFDNLDAYVAANC